MKVGLVLREETARGRGAVRVLRLEGSDALAVLRKLAGAPQLAPGDLRLVHLRQADGVAFEDALAWVDSEQAVELHVHGSPVVVARVIAALEERVEVTSPVPPRRLEERARERLADAEGEAAARVLLDQAEGALRRAIEGLLELLEREEPAAARERLGLLLESEPIVRALLEPPRIVLAGPVNAGKSTLFNALVGSERVVVDAEQGTTRDAIRERVRLGNYVVDLFDTAGERGLEGRDLDRPGAAEVERAGQRLGRRLRAGADLVLWLDPEGRAPEGEVQGGKETPLLRVLRSQADLPRPAAAITIAPELAARNRPLEACDTVVAVFHEALGLPREPWLPGAPAFFEPEPAGHLRALLSAGAENHRLESALRALLAD